MEISGKQLMKGKLMILIKLLERILQCFEAFFFCLFYLAVTKWIFYHFHYKFPLFELKNNNTPMALLCLNK